MPSRIAMASAAALFLGYLPATPALAQEDLATHIHNLRIACEQSGDRGACVRFGIVIGEHPERRAEWERTHPDWFWWEHH